ncbi:MAG: methanol dehydrogenase [Sphingomonadales bacterium]|nr:methanol dehydrogenase [Sphingomonadales bacterium]
MQSLRITGLKYIVALFVALFAVPAFAQTFPPLTGRVVDAAKILSAEQVAALDGKLQALETASGHQLVVATIPDLQGYPIEDYGYKLGRAWALGKKDVNDGAILLVAPNDRKVRVEVGYGLEPVLTDAYSGVIINNQILPHFKANDYPGGIDAGVDAIAEQIKLPPDQAQARMAAAATQTRNKGAGIPIGVILPVIFIFIFFVLPLLRRGAGGRTHGGGSGIGQVILWSALDAAMRGGRGGGGSDWGGGGGFGGGGGGGGGFSGGGGSFGGGGASGGW